MSQILCDLSQIADEGPGNSFLLDRVSRRLKGTLQLSDSLADIESEIRAHCTVTRSPAGPVLQGWALRRSSREPQ